MCLERRVRGAGIPLLAQPEVGEGGGWISRLCLGKRTHRVSVTYVVHCLTDGIWRGADAGSST